jgi:hypothetical protein
MNDRMETILFLIFCLLVLVYLGACLLDTVENLREAGYLAAGLTPLGNRRAGSLLWVNTTQTEATTLQPGYVRVAGRISHVDGDPAVQRLECAVYGQFSVRCKEVRPNVFMSWLEPDPMGFVDVPMWIARNWGLCDQYGNLCNGGTPIRSSLGHKLSKSLQKDASRVLRQ